MCKEKSNVHKRNYKITFFKYSVRTIWFQVDILLCQNGYLYRQLYSDNQPDMAKWNMKTNKKAANIT